MNELKRGGLEKNQMSKKVHHTILTWFASQEKLLLTFLMIFQWYLRLNKNQFMEQDSKY